MDPRSPITGTVIEGEDDLEHAWFNQPCKVSPQLFTDGVIIVLVTLAAIAAVLWGM